MADIRAYDPAADYPALRACFIELQTWERQFEPSMPRPEDAADPYLADMLERCAASCGRVFVAEQDGAIVGFVCLMARVAPISTTRSSPIPIFRIWSSARPIAAAASGAG